MRLVLMVAVGGALGSMARYGVGVLSARLFGAGFPWGTLAVNIMGSFLMGVLVAAAALRLSLSQELRAFLAVGVLGGFTTFSSFALDVVFLFEKKQNMEAFAYLGCSVVLSILALVAGMHLTRSLLA